MTNEQLPAVVNEQLPAPVVSGHTANILSLMQQGMNGGMSAEAIGQYAALYEKAMARDAETLFLKAKMAFQAVCPVIGKNRTADLGTGKASYRYADLEKIVKAIRPLLEQFGFSYDFAQEYDKDIVTVTCFLRHEAGHVEETKFSGPWATNAGMSAIQKSASATTFCQRYALRMALGLPVGEDDDAPPDPYENPTPREGAATEKPRGQRQQAKPEPTPKTLISADTRNATYREWRDCFSNEIEDQSLPSLLREFAKWCCKQTGDEWNPSNVAEWTQARLDKVNAKLPGGEA